MEKVVKDIYEAATEGNITSLNNLLQKDSLILERCMIITSFEGTPLHVAAMLGHLEFSLELLKQKPELAGELDSRKSSALHLASAKGYVEIVKALVSVKPEMCFTSDRDGNNPLHVAAIKGKVSVLRELVKLKPNAACARVDRDETILHLCVQFYQLDAMKVVIEDLNDQEFVNAKDDQGNTILHLAVADKQIKIIKYLLDNTTIDVNAQNSHGLTALNILAQSRRDSKDLDIADCLQQAAANKSNENAAPRQMLRNHNSIRLQPSNSQNQNITNSNIRRENSSLRGGKSWKDYFNKQDQWLKKQSNALMVVASLIATMAFQAGVNPPSGVWQDNEGTHIAGNSIFADQKPDVYKNFVIVNTISFISSLCIILLLISGLPLKRKMFVWILMVIMWISLSSTALTYLISVSATSTQQVKNTLDHIREYAFLGYSGLMVLLIVVHIIRIVYFTLRFIVITIWKVVKWLIGTRRSSSSNPNNNMV